MRGPRTIPSEVRAEAAGLPPLAAELRARRPENAAQEADDSVFYEFRTNMFFRLSLAGLAGSTRPAITLRRPAPRARGMGASCRDRRNTRFLPPISRRLGAVRSRIRVRAATRRARPHPPDRMNFWAGIAGKGARGSVRQAACLRLYIRHARDDDRGRTRFCAARRDHR
jgi:hypothetical protein